MRILAFTHQLRPGGAQRYLFDQVRRLLARPGVSCTVVASRDGYWRRRLETLGAEVISTPYPLESDSEYESAIELLGRRVDAPNFDVVLVNTLDAFIGADLGTRLGLPVVWSLHESYTVPTWWRNAERADAHPYVRTRLEHALKASSALIFPAEATRALYARYADEARMITAPYGLEFDEIDAFRRNLSPDRYRRARAWLPADSTVVLCLGIIQQRKGQVTLARAFREVCDDHPTAICVFVGDREGRYSQALRDYLARTGLSSRCALLPVSANPYMWFATGDIFALTSDVEASPVTILEAMAFELPVVATSVFGVPELMEDARHGHLCVPNDVTDVARALDRALSASDQQRAELTFAAQERVRERHAPEPYAGGLHNLLRTLSREPDAPPSWDGAGVAERGL